MLVTRTNGCYVDGTFGRGGHSCALLEQLDGDARLIGIDRDPAAVATGKQLAEQDQRFCIHAGAFDCLPELMRREGQGFDGILLDLGVSSPQLDDAGRGFSFLRDGPLDMRMNPGEGESVADWLAHAPESTIADVIHDLGEEKRARAIARLIVKTRQETALTRTAQLADLVSSVVRREPGKHPATRTFQAFRLFINKELELLDRVLEQSLDCLKTGGRLMVISFHSLEDRRVKRFMRSAAGRTPRLRGGLPLPEEQPARLTLLGRAIHADEAEVTSNPRARSAIMRVAERLPQVSQ